MCSRVSKSLERCRFGHTNMRGRVRAHGTRTTTHTGARAAEPRQSRRVRAVPCPRPLSGARDGSHWMCGHTEGRSAPSLSRARQLGAATTGTVRLRPSESMPAVMTSPGPTGPTPSGVPVSSRSPSSSVCTRETASSSAGTPAARGVWGSASEDRRGASRQGGGLSSGVQPAARREARYCVSQSPRAARQRSSDRSSHSAAVPPRHSRGATCRATRGRPLRPREPSR